MPSLPFVMSTTQAAPAPVVEMKGITKTFGGVHALQGVDLDIFRGEVHVILGENGAGKSTLMKILSGTYPPTAGKIIIDGQAHSSLKPTQAAHLGIAIIYQELSVISELSALENLFVGRIPLRKQLGMPVVDWPLMEREPRAVLQSLGLAIDVHTPVGHLSIAHRQMIEIAKA